MRTLLLCSAFSSSSASCIAGSLPRLSWMSVTRMPASHKRLQQPKPLGPPPMTQTAGPHASVISASAGGSSLHSTLPDPEITPNPMRTWFKYMKIWQLGVFEKLLTSIFSGKIVNIEIPSFHRALWIIQQRKSKQQSQFWHGAFWWGMAATIAVRVILPPLPPALWIGSPWGLLHGLRTCWGSALEL